VITGWASKRSSCRIKVIVAFVVMLIAVILMIWLSARSARPGRAAAGRGR
jgi:hypothetical protein